MLRGLWDHAVLGRPLLPATAMIEAAAAAASTLLDDSAGAAAGAAPGRIGGASLALVDVAILAPLLLPRLAAAAPSRCAALCLHLCLPHKVSAVMEATNFPLLTATGNVSHLRGLPASTVAEDRYYLLNLLGQCSPNSTAVRSQGRRQT